MMRGGIRLKSCRFALRVHWGSLRVCPTHALLAEGAPEAGLCRAPPVLLASPSSPRGAPLSGAHEGLKEKGCWSLDGVQAGIRSADWAEGPVRTAGRSRRIHDSCRYSTHQRELGPQHSHERPSWYSIHIKELHDTAHLKEHCDSTHIECRDSTHMKERRDGVLASRSVVT
ncbi:hypothetical protein NDU88_008011 [Pleurodeles waltl]|uniref:Uncharacterized protein n=1 Tax=Pleurodeles waltl TaxID=8319 RepID=A0AAV7U382_PLEWA|nr:hypothetical protein NDU88_008011 [Pleurodeles waltl]